MKKLVVLSFAAMFASNVYGAYKHTFINETAVPIQILAKIQCM